MKKARFRESEIIAVLKQYEAGKNVDELCREFEISKATFYNWKARYAGMEATEFKRPKEIVEENNLLKKMYADLSLNYEILKDILSKKGWTPPSRNS